MIGICLDFDGTFCKPDYPDDFDFDSLDEPGWRKFNVIGTPEAFPGVIERLREYLSDERLQVYIFSGRNSTPFGIGGIKLWLAQYLSDPEITRIQFPIRKPHGVKIIIDDKNWPPWDGRLPTVEEILSFKPWWAI
jgi:hypothetical protein